MTLRRYLLVRTGWAAGVLFAFVSIAYVGIWVAGDFGHQPGYAGFLWGALRGSRGHTAATLPPSEPMSVSSLVWHAAPITLSLLLVTAVFTLLVAVPLALLARRGRAARRSVRAFEFLGVSLLPLWTGLMIQDISSRTTICSTPPDTAPDLGSGGSMPRSGRMARAPRLAGGRADGFLCRDLLAAAAA